MTAGCEEETSGGSDWRLTEREHCGIVHVGQIMKLELNYPWMFESCQQEDPSVIREKNKKKCNYLFTYIISGAGHNIFWKN